MSGLLLTFAERWKNDGQAVALVPYDRFLTGRIPNIEDYPWPSISLIPGGGRRVYRSDKFEGSRRILALHIYTDPARLEEDGERAAEIARRLYASQAFNYDFGQVIDILDNGPPSAQQINAATFTYWEVTKIFSLCIEQPRLDLATCPAGGSGSSGVSSSWRPSSGSGGSSSTSSGNPAVCEDFVGQFLGGCQT